MREVWDLVVGLKAQTCLTKFVFWLKIGIEPHHHKYFRYANYVELKLLSFKRGRHGFVCGPRNKPYSVEFVPLDEYYIRLRDLANYLDFRPEPI